MAHGSPKGSPHVDSGLGPDRRIDVRAILWTPAGSAHGVSSSLNVSGRDDRVYAAL